MNHHTSSYPAKQMVSYKTPAKLSSYLSDAFRNTDKYYIPKTSPVKANAPASANASCLAHELRNPLTNINLAIDLLDLSIMDKELKEFVDIVRRSSARINVLVNEFLKYQQVDDIKEESYPLHQLLDEVLEMSEDRIALKRIAIAKAYAAGDDRVLMHRPKIKMALTNIIINAIDAMPSVNGELTVITSSNNGEYSIEIKDNGCGISEENLKYIFKPYFTNKPGGLGMGLSATDAILRAHHVEVKVQSIEGKGTKFTLLFRKTILANLTPVKKWTGALKIN